MTTSDTDLAALILTHKGSRSYDRMSRDCDGALTGARLHQLATGTLKTFPDPDTLRAVARALMVSVTTVVLACSRSLDLDVRLYDEAGIDVTGRSPPRSTPSGRPCAPCWSRPRPPQT